MKRWKSKWALMAHLHKAVNAKGEDLNSAAQLFVTNLLLKHYNGTNTNRTSLAERVKLEIEHTTECKVNVTTKWIVYDTIESMFKWVWFKHSRINKNMRRLIEQEKELM